MNGIVFNGNAPVFGTLGNCLLNSSDHVARELREHVPAIHTNTVSFFVFLRPHNTVGTIRVDSPTRNGKGFIRVSHTRLIILQGRGIQHRQFQRCFAELIRFRQIKISIGDIEFRPEIKITISHTESDTVPVLGIEGERIRKFANQIHIETYLMPFSRKNAVCIWNFY